MDFGRTVPNRQRQNEPRSLHLLVMGPDVFETHPIVNEGVIVLGRDPECDIPLLDKQASRKHARLHVGTVFELEDLASVNGTWLREDRLDSNVRVRVWPGEAIRIGNLVIMLQRHRPRLEARRVWPHNNFEALLAYQCDRTLLAGGGLAVARVRVNEPITPARFAATITPVLEPPDLLALYASNDFELLLAGRGAGRAEDTIQRIRERLQEEGFTARTAVAVFPQDGRDPEALTSVVADRMIGLSRVDVAGERVVVESEAMRGLYKMAMRAAASNINIMILGETGSGKEVLAHAIHRSSTRSAASLVSLNCAALPETLLESELFGHEKGAFTGADRAKPGLLESAPGGTIFLDEVAEMPLSTQAKLLRAIEAKVVTPVGSVRPRAIDVRFMAATNRPLEEDVRAKRFRSDLFFRLNGITLSLPPLRERQAEIEPLARLFLSEAAAQAGRNPVPSFTDEAIGWMHRYPWPGNVRELRNVVERAVVVSSGDVIDLEQLPIERMRAVEPESSDLGDILSMPDSERRDRIVRTLDNFAGNQTRAAGVLGISRKTLLQLLDRYGIARPRKK
jgi:DNA-binding NtrC family response regulator